MGVVKTVKEARTNFEQALPNIPGRYAQGIDKGTWADAAGSDAAEANFNTTMSAVLAEKRRQTGCRQAGDTAWKAGAKTKGQPIIQQRIRDALGKWETNFGPVYDSVVSMLPRLPAKTTDFRNNISTRLVPVVEQWKRGSGKM